MIVDAENKILGRLASKVARLAKDGEEVHVVNAEKAVISGNEEEIKEEYRTKHQRGTRHDGPYFPQSPSKILKRSIRGMLPYKSSEGKEAFRRIRTYIGEPDRMDDEPEEIDVREGSDLRGRNYVKLGEVSRSIGWKPQVEDSE